MFSKDKKAVKIVRKGNLDKLKEFVDKNPECLTESIKWKYERNHPRYTHATGNLLHLSAFFDQPEMIEYLVNEKGMDVNQLNKTQRTPLHRASEEGCYSATHALLSLGADPTLECRDGTVYSLCTNASIKELLQPYHEEKLKQDDEKQKKEEEKQKQEAAAKIEGTWITISPGEYMFERELPGGRYRLTNVFNLATETQTSITENLQNGQIAQETKPLDEKTRKMVEDARAVFDKPQNDEQSPEKAKPSAKTVPQEKSAGFHNYDHLTGL